jgi:hypothetical protein
LCSEGRHYRSRLEKMGTGLRSDSLCPAARLSMEMQNAPKSTSGCGATHFEFTRQVIRLSLSASGPLTVQPNQNPASLLRNFACTWVCSTAIISTAKLLDIFEVRNVVDLIASSSFVLTEITVKRMHLLCPLLLYDAVSI